MSRTINNCYIEKHFKDASYEDGIEDCENGIKKNVIEQ